MIHECVMLIALDLRWWC